MKGCDNYSPTIQLDLDGELSGNDLEDLRAHLANCETCQAELEAEESLSTLLRQSRPLYRAPDALRKRVMSDAESFAPTKTYSPLRFRKRVMTELARPLPSSSRRVHQWSALVATIMLVAAGILLHNFRLRREGALGACSNCPP